MSSTGMDEDDIDFPKWMVQYSQTVKVVDKKPERRNLEQVQGPSSSGNFSKTRFPTESSFSGVSENYQDTAARKLQDDGVSCLLHVSDIAFECEQLLNRASSLREPLLLGLDLDWPSNYSAFLVKTNSIHLCYGENHCILFEVLHVKKLPLVFIKLIKHPNIRLLGHNIIEDLLKLGKDFNIDVKQVIASNLILSSVEQKLSCQHRWSYKTTHVHQEESGSLEHFIYEPALDTTAQFLGRIKYSTSFEDCAAFSEEILIQADNYNELPLGFDLEWPFRYGRGSGKVALIQICPDKSICYIFHVFYLKTLPKALILLLRHPKVRLTGLNIANDIRKLGRDFKVDLSDVLKNNLVELCSLANEKLNCSHRWSLAGLAANQLKIILDKGPVRVSNWANANLTKQQITYAATDAYVSLLWYEKAWQLQDIFADAVKRKTCPWDGGVVLMLEHPPVYTIGIRTKGYEEDDEKKLKSLGAEFHRTNRGGLITFHGPGQLVVYPIINLQMWKPSIKWYIDNLEETIIDLCSEFGVPAHRYPPYPGIWVGEKKVCAIGVHASRYVTTHGIAINCNTDLKWYDHIVPCGIEGKGVTSLSEQLGEDVGVSDVVPKFLKSFNDKFSSQMILINE
ncbi:hypothetical protein GE061_017961 [Apolygus lucorum]|uniref:lipoyl(octanoyl) transferase n=1 Tax=Apolygus lucorum TaxID=248454 RepID=A0A8S9XGH3_APOLU|nr:hypothetical protein GE061_017961 [Apolygus lucorum]